MVEPETELAATDGQKVTTDQTGSDALDSTDSVIVGVGNPTVGDDGVGRAVVRAVEAVPATFAATTAFFALEAMSGHDRAVVVDAISRDAPPGSVHRFRLDTAAEATPEVTLHDVTFADAVRSGRGVYDLPERVVLVGVVPERLETEIGLSDPVTAAVPTAVEMARAEAGVEPRTRLDRGDQPVETTWYCQNCETEIDASAVDDHEERGHSVRGRARPNRLLSEDPWETGSEAER